MKALVLSAVAALVFSANSAFAEPVDVKIPMVCLSEDGTVGAEVYPRQGQITIIDGLNVATYVETDLMKFTVFDNIASNVTKDERSFSLDVSRNVEEEAIEYASLFSTSAITLDYLPEGGARSTFTGYLSGIFVTQKGNIKLPRTRVRCEYLINGKSGVG